jgi:UDP-galactopyranose mutase
MQPNAHTSSLNQARFIKGREDLICLSHLRWDFVYQRPQHLMSRCARDRRVFFIEEPVVDEGEARLLTEIKTVVWDEIAYVWVVVPHLPAGLSNDERANILRILLNQFLYDHNIQHYLLWYYTPEALSFTRHLAPRAIIYDCMDELSLFKDANPQLCALEAELFERADLVFTGGLSLYEAKRTKHSNVYCFPSSIDMKHFVQARNHLPEPEDQREIPHPRLGFFGVLDERLDIQLLAGMANKRPDWHFVLIGPIVKIDPDQLPKNDNIHYLGMKAYQDLPSYLAWWDVALLLFALNESTRFISPTKTPEYLAGGRPVVSTPIPDVVRFYGEKQLVRIAGTVDEFIQAIEQTLTEKVTLGQVVRRDAFLTEMSWDNTWRGMTFLISQLPEKVVSAQVFSAQKNNNHVPIAAQ